MINGKKTHKSFSYEGKEKTRSFFKRSKSLSNEGSREKAHGELSNDTSHEKAKGKLSNDRSKGW